MKRSICILLLLFIPLQVFAKDETVEIVGDDAFKLYDALNITATQIPNDIHGYSLSQKSLPGLTCTFWLNTWETKAGCGCIFIKELSHDQMQEIYSKIYVHEGLIEDGNPKIYVKEVGELDFTRMMYQEGHEFYTFYEFSFLISE